MFNAVKLSTDYLLKKRHLEKRDPNDEENVEGKIIIVTGANSGIGKATTSELVERGATVIMACRHLERAQETVEEIRTKTSKGQLVNMELDLGDLNSIRKFVEEFRSQYSYLNILINNAGISDQNGVALKTNDGFESHFGINHLGHFLLTNLLLDSLKKGAPSRIISVASTLFATSKLNMDDLMLEKRKSHGFLNFRPYGNSKLANLLFIKTLAKKLDGTGVTTYALCPGLAATNVFRTQPWYKTGITKLTIRMVGFSAKKGCQTTLLCALSKKLAAESGKMYRFGKEWENVIQNLDSEMANELWDKSEQLVGLNNNSYL